MTDDIRVLSAGSLRHALPAIIKAFSAATGTSVSISLGPAGLLRERIEAGERFDLFASANMAHPRRLADMGITEEPVCFATNRLCVVARPDLGMTTANFLDVLTDPRTRIGTSTPGDDPSGDYAFEVFDRIESLQPGAGEELKARASQLVGGRNSPPSPGGVGAFVVDGQVDLMLYYYSNARLIEDDPAFHIVEIPTAFAPKIEYGLALHRKTKGETRLLSEFILSDMGKAALLDAGFMLP